MKPANGWRTGAFSLSLLIVLSTSAIAEDAQSTLTQICDQSAASPLDPDRPTGVSGVAPDKINTKIAIPACEAALAADPQNSRQMYQLGRAYFAAKDYEKAKRFYEQAAAGSAAAMYNLGFMYVKGLGTANDPSTARQWFEKAAERGFPAAMDSIGVMYYRGEGVDRDYVAARRWFEKAAAAGADIAKQHLANLSHTERVGGAGGFVGSWQVYTGTNPITRRPVFSAYATHTDTEWVGVRCGGDGVPVLLIATDARSFKDGEQIEAELRVDEEAVVNTVFMGTADAHVLATAFMQSFYESFLGSKRFAVTLHAGQASGFTFEYQFKETGKALKSMLTNCPASAAVAPRKLD